MLTPIEQIIKALVDHYGSLDHPNNVIAPEEAVFTSTPYGTFRIRKNTEKTLVLPNGHRLHVMTDASRKATQVEDDEHQHAIVRPDVIRTGTRFHR